MQKKIFATWACLLLLIDPAYAQWQRVQSPSDRVLTFIESDSRILAGSEDTGLWMSSDGGKRFTTYPTGLSEMTFDIRDFEKNGSTVWAGIFGGGVCVSPDGGTTWSGFNTGFETQAFVAGITQIGDTLFAAVDYWQGLQASGVYRTPVDRANWKLAGTGFPGTLAGVTSLTATESGVMLAGAVLAGPRGNIQVSPDNGRSWVSRAIPGVQGVMTLEADGNTVYAGTTAGMYVTDNYGETWVKLAGALGNQTVDDILIHNRTIFAAADSMGVLTSADGGESWNSITGNLPVEDDFVSALFLHEGTLFAALSPENGVWSAPLSTTAVETDNISPNAVTLSQNFPNPFNPITTIRFELSRPSHTTLTVFDITGRKLRILIDGMYEPGVHSATFDASGLANGVYYYRLKTGEFSLTRKLVLLK